MRVLIAYSSRTGNTKKIAEAIAEAQPQAQLASLPAEVDLDRYDFVFAGLWCDKDQPDEEWKKFFSSILSKKKPCAIFGTMGSDPFGEYGVGFTRRLFNTFAKDPVVKGLRLWQGKIDPKVIEILYKTSDLSKLDEVTRSRLQEASSHPNEDDCRMATEWASIILKNLK